MRQPPRTIAIFDLDRTITWKGTFSPFLLLTARRRPWRYLGVPLVIALMLLYKAGLLGRKRLKELMLKIMVSGCSRDSIERASRDFAAWVLRHSAKPAALQQIAAHRAAGDILVLATASMDFYAEEIARVLQFDMVVATPSAWSGKDKLLPCLGGPNCYDGDKFRMVKAALSDYLRPGSTARVVAYSDHISDFGLLKWADDGFVVDPRETTAREARKQGLRLLDWQSKPRPGKKQKKQMAIREDVIPS